MARTIDTPTRGLRALVLDPDAGALRSLAWALEARFFSVCTAPDGTRGLERLLDELLTLDVLVIDAGLPHRDALAFAELIRRAGGERELAMVVVAATPAPALRAALLGAGVDAVVDRRHGTDAVALAAVAAVAARASRAIDVDEEVPTGPFTGARPFPGTRVAGIA
jgi:CheY-like chemotaxis protein